MFHRSTLRHTRRLFTWSSKMLWRRDKIDLLCFWNITLKTKFWSNFVWKIFLIEWTVNTGEEPCTQENKTQTINSQNCWQISGNLAQSSLSFVAGQNGDFPLSQKFHWIKFILMPIKLPFVIWHNAACVCVPHWRTSADCSIMEQLQLIRLQQREPTIYHHCIIALFPAMCRTSEPNCIVGSQQWAVTRHKSTGITFHDQFFVISVINHLLLFIVILWTFSNGTDTKANCKWMKWFKAQER